MHPGIAEVVAQQHGVITRDQALGSGYTPGGIRWRLESGDWRRLYPTVYLTHTGPVGWWSAAAAAVAYAGEGAVLALASAAHAHGLQPEPPALIVVAVPHERKVARQPGFQLRRRIYTAQARCHGIVVTDVEDTLLDLAGARGSRLDSAVGNVARAVQQRRTTPERVAERMASRSRQRWRDELKLALGDVADGAESVLEVRYVRDVERRHDLPRSRRQVPVEGDRIRRDAEYEEFATVVEVDGRIGHVGEGWSRDRHRDRRAARSGRITLRAGWLDVTREPCELAADIAGTLRSRGWTGIPTACSPTCAVRRVR